MWCSSDSYSILKTFIYFVVSWHCKYLILSHYFVSCPPVPSIYSSLHVEQMVTHEHLPISNLQICFEKKACLLRLYIYIYIYITHIYIIKKYSYGVFQSSDLSRQKFGGSPSIIPKNINVLYLIYIKESFSGKYQKS